MMDLREEEVDEDEEDRGRIWEIGIDTFISIKVSFVFKYEAISQQIFCAINVAWERTDCEATYSVLPAQWGCMIL
jgi:hypothetical protein